MTTRTEPRSYARVADSSSDSLEDGASATKLERRWTAAEKQARRGTAPAPRLPFVEDATLGEQIAGYVHITRDPVRSDRKRRLVALCYRIHGEAFLPHVQRIFARTGTATNLLWEIRCLPPLDDRPSAHKASDRSETAPGPEPLLLPGLIYSADRRPPFDPTSTRRFDRRPSNPDAAGFFPDRELAAPPSRSRTAEALNR
jgi:hypothetical protein